MQKIVIFFKRSFICLLLSFTLVCNNTAAVTYQAAAIPVVYTAWEVLVTIFALLGITLSLSDHIDAAASDEAAQDVLDAYAAWKVSIGEGVGDADADGKDDIYGLVDPLEWIQGDKLVMPQEELNDFKSFYQSVMAPAPTVQPIDNTDIKKMNYQEFIDWSTAYFSDYSSCSKWKSYTAYIYDHLAEYDYCGLLVDTGTVLYFDCLNHYYQYDPITSCYWGYIERSNGGTIEFQRFYSLTDGSGSSMLRDKYVRLNYQSNSISNYWQSGANTGQAIYEGYDIVAFIVDGCLYDPSIFTKPINATTSMDKGAIYGYNDFVKNKNNISSSVVDVPGSVGGVDLTDKIEDGAYDVLTPGQDYDADDKEVVGNVVVPLPSGDIFDQYQNGEITYEELLDELGATPIDKSSGTNLLTGEFLDIQTGILSGVNSLVNYVGGLLDGLLDMLLSLFIPSEGYFEAYFTRINDFFDSRLGFLYTPFDLLIRFLSALPSVDHSSTQLYFPGLKFHEYVLCEPMYVELDLRDEFPALYRYMYFITDTILIGAVLWLLQIKTKELIKG